MEMVQVVTQENLSVRNEIKILNSSNDMKVKIQMTIMVTILY